MELTPTIRNGFVLASITALALTATGCSGTNADNRGNMDSPAGRFEYDYAAHNALTDLCLRNSVYDPDNHQSPPALRYNSATDELTVTPVTGTVLHFDGFQQTAPELRRLTCPPNKS